MKRFVIAAAIAVLTSLGLAGTANAGVVVIIILGNEVANFEHQGRASNRIELTTGDDPGVATNEIRGTTPDDILHELNAVAGIDPSPF